MNIVPEMMTKLAKCGSLIEIEEVILRSMLELGQRVMQTYLETLDDQLNSEAPATHRVINRQPRTINFSFGPVTFKRRYYQVEKAPNEFFLDRYHCLRKIENTLRRQNVLTPRALTAVRTNDFDELMAVLDTFEGNASKDQEEEVKRLRAYFTRNWAYVTSPKQRGYEIANIGSIKSSHRAYTYRMKKQGKAWTIKGAKAMLSLIEARKKDQLEEVLENSLKQLIKAPELSEEVTSTVTIKVRDFLKVTPPRPSQGAVNGSIPLDAPTSSPMGRMIKAFSH